MARDSGEGVSAGREAAAPPRHRPRPAPIASEERVPIYDIGSPRCDEAASPASTGCPWEEAGLPVGLCWPSSPVFDFDISSPPPESEEEEDGSPSGIGEQGSLADLSGEALGARERERRRLCDVLWLARPAWEPRDLVAAEKKLARVGMGSVDELAEALSRGELTHRLRQAGLQTFHEETLRAFHSRVAAVALGGDRASPGGSVGSPRRSLCDALWAARPTWMPAHLASAERKLASIGVEDLPTLDACLREDLNQMLRKAGQKTFGHETLVALRRQLDKVYGRVDAEDKPAAWMRGDVDPEPALRDLVWESKPTWSATELTAVMKKLAEVGVDSVDTLSKALAEGLNQRLRSCGLKTLGGPTMRALQDRLEADPKLPRLARALSG